MILLYNVIPTVLNIGIISFFLVAILVLFPSVVFIENFEYIISGKLANMSL